MIAVIFIAAALAFPLVWVVIALIKRKDDKHLFDKEDDE